jgi:hypothetical protein
MLKSQRHVSIFPSIGACNQLIDSTYHTSHRIGVFPRFLVAGSWVQGRDEVLMRSTRQSDLG